MPEESTTPDLIELTRLLNEAISRRDFDAVMSFWAQDAVLDLSTTALGPYEGHAAIQAFFEEWVGAYDDLQLEFEENHDLGNGVAFAVAVQNARLAGSTGSVQGRWGAVVVWRDGLIKRMTTYPYADIDHARAAAQRLAEERG
jgi:ketosteroid isomerase-like protein